VRFSAALKRVDTGSLALVFGSAAAVGYLLPQNRFLAEFAAVAGLALGVFAGNVVRLAVVATAGVWLIKRVPGADVSVTDVLIAAAGAAALVAGAGRAIQPRDRGVLRSFAFYLATLSVTLLFNQYFRADLEWLHRVALVAGAVLVGAWLVSTGFHHQALRALLLVTALISGFAVLYSVSHGFAPAEPLGYQKNFIGSITATVLLVLLAAHKEFRLPVGWLRIAGVVVAAGLLASHSRGAMVALVVGAFIWWFRRSSMSTPRLRSLVILGAVAIAVFAFISIRNELRILSPYSSTNQRVQVERATERLWINHPFTGVGLRFFKTPAYAGYQAPTNVFNEVLAEAGVFGLLGFVVFVVGSLRVLGRRSGALATAALCVVSARFVHGLFDIYWTGGTTGLVWIIAGMGLATVPSDSLPAAALRQGWS
jgi:O-Antigen ligase